MPIGVLGTYLANGDPDDECYGLYIELAGHRILVDIRTDKLKSEREQRALFLHAQTQALEKSLGEFIAMHPEYGARRINSIGLHSKHLDQGEVFWDPDGYTLLKGLSFVKE